VRFAFGFLATFIAAGDAFGVFTKATGAATLRPKPLAFAMVERCSE